MFLQFYPLEDRCNQQADGVGKEDDRGPDDEADHRPIVQLLLLGSMPFTAAIHGYATGMNTAAGILLLVVSLLSVIVVLAAFVWAARKDGEEDRALQRRLGIRRRTRLGR
jgi:hypothetical protein